MNRLPLAAFALALAPLAALADTAAAPAATVPAVTVPPPDCKKPDLGGVKMTRDVGVHDVQADVQAYLECLKAYATQEKNIAQAHGAAANQTINQYNDFVKEFNDYQNQPKH
ncbi:MAG TPA: hypothetical protein VNX47_10635 [Nevskia sp.]|jgi:hypothetical protein|nr:hypothetical protein [Nevskia sp.]